MRIFRYYVLIIFLSLIPLISLFSTPLLSHTHDGFVHLARIAAYFKALKDFQIPVRWAGDLNYGYGMPLFNFMYQLPYLVASFFVALGLGLTSAFKFTLALSFVLSGIFMFGFAKTLFGDAKKAFLVVVFYQFAPFRLIEVLIRGSFGEVYTYAFLPLVLWGTLLVFKKRNYRYVVLTAIASSLLVLSHNAISLVFFAIAVGFVLVFGRNIKDYFWGLLSLCLGLLLATFYWLPAILEHKYTYGDLFMKDTYLAHFPPLQNFFIPNFFNNVWLQTGGVSVQFGIFHMLAIALTVFILLTNKKTEPVVRKLFLFCVVVSFLALFFMEPISKPIWANISLLRQFQFPWRLLSIISFTTALMSISLFYFNPFVKKWLYSLLIFLIIFSTAYYWKPQLGLDKINEDYYWNFPLNTTYYGETDLIWSKGPASSYPKQRVELIGGKGTISNFKKKSNLQTFSVNAFTKIQLVSHTEYFPGWRVYVDNNLTPIEFQDQNWRGEITFYVEKGFHQIRVSFGEDKLRLLADILTVLTVLSLLFFWIFRRYRKII